MKFVIPWQFFSPKYSFFSFLSSNIFYILLIFFLEFFNCFLCTLQIFLSFPSIRFSCEPFLSYQVFIFLPYLSLVQNFLDFPFLFSLNYNWSWLLLSLPFYLPYIFLYSTDINYQMYFYCTR